ncbi:MAG: PilZ domain-containing protein [Candidatus Omnitrophota bacterium]
MEDIKDEQRLFQRFSARFPVKIKDSRDEFGTKMFLRDASAEGVKVTSRERMFINDKISLSVKLPDGNEPLNINGRVVWIKSKEPNILWDVGLKFHQVSLMSMQRLFQFVTEEPQL